ncbi:MAG: hypothetical protein ACOC16_03730 [Nanoarchaeota archaeon]
MAYDIFDDDIKDKTYSKFSSSSKKTTKKPKSFLKTKIKPMYIHIIIIIIILFLLGIYIFNNFDFSFKNSKNQEEIITIVGDLNKFNETYHKSIQMYVTDFTLETRNGKFNGKSQEIELINFSGLIYLENNSIIFKGKTQKIIYGTNQLKLDGDNFILTSKRKTNIDLYFNEINLNYNKGRLKLDSNLNYKFENTTILFENYNFSFSYDGTFSFQGTANKFDLIRNNPQITISYQKEIENESSS